MKCAVCGCVGLTQEQVDAAEELVHGQGYDTLCVGCAQAFVDDRNQLLEAAEKLTSSISLREFIVDRWELPVQVAASPEGVLWRFSDGEECIETNAELVYENADEFDFLSLQVQGLRPPGPWTLEMSDDGGSSETVEFEELPDADDIAAACQEWAEGGEWDNGGVRVSVRWTLTDDAVDQEVDGGWEDVYIPPDHEALIRAAGGDNDCRHDWTGEGEGGLAENPGVWSTGGTGMLFHRHCTRCGLLRKYHAVGPQHKPGECDTVEYEQPDYWCVEHQNREPEDCPEDCSTRVESEGGDCNE